MLRILCRFFEKKLRKKLSCRKVFGSFQKNYARPLSILCRLPKASLLREVATRASKRLAMRLTEGVFCAALSTTADPFCRRDELCSSAGVQRTPLRVILSGVRPRFYLRFARCCFAVRLRSASLRMTRADAVETRRANGNAVRISQGD